VLLLLFLPAKEDNYAAFRLRRMAAKVQLCWRLMLSPPFHSERRSPAAQNADPVLIDRCADVSQAKQD